MPWIRPFGPLEVGTGSASLARIVPGIRVPLPTRSVVRGLERPGGSPER